MSEAAAHALKRCISGPGRALTGLPGAHLQRGRVPGGRVPGQPPGGGSPHPLPASLPCGVCRGLCPESSGVPARKAPLLAPRSRHSIPARAVLLCTSTLLPSAGLLLAWGGAGDSPFIIFFRYFPSILPLKLCS